MLKRLDNRTVTLSVQNLNVRESAPGNSTIVTATLDKTSDRYIVVNLKKRGSADSRYDYRLPDQIIIPEGRQSASIPLTTLEDTLDEASETVTIEVDDITNGAQTGPQQHTIIIVDDDDAPTVTLSVTNLTAHETPPEDQTTLTARLSDLSGLDVTIGLIKSGSATQMSDYTLADKITIPAGDFSKSVILVAKPDTLIEGNETVTVQLDKIVNGTSGASSIQTIKIVDVPPPSVILSIENAGVNESGISNKSKVTATLSTRSTLDVVVNLNLAGSATAGVDYALAEQIIVPAGRLSASTALTAVADQVSEGSESVIVSIANVQNGVAVSAQPQSVIIFNGH
ncbi:MAG: Calx-beta domain-containing protein [Nitrospirota bacterium]